MRSLYCAIIASLFLAPFSAALWLVRTYGINVFWLDGWHMTDLIEGPLRTRELFERYNEHLYVLPRLAAMATGWNSVSQMYLVVVALGLAVLFVILSAGLSGPRLLWAAPIPALLLGFRHQENMLWGNQTSFAFALCLSVGALYATGTRRWYLGIPLAIGATLSAAQGSFAWPAAFLVLLLKRRWLAAGALAMIGAVVGTWYSMRYQGAASVSYALSRPLETLEYLSVVAGAVFSAEPLVWIGAGVLALSVVAMWYARPQIAGVTVYALLCLASIAVGRVELGTYTGCCPATASRYAMFAALLLTGVYLALASAYTPGDKLPGILASLLLAGMLFGIVLSYQEGLMQARESRNDRESYRDLVRNDLDPPELSQPYAKNPDPTAVIERAGVNAFADREAR